MLILVFAANCVMALSSGLQCKRGCLNSLVCEFSPVYQNVLHWEFRADINQVLILCPNSVYSLPMGDLSTELEKPVTWKSLFTLFLPIHYQEFSESSFLFPVLLFIYLSIYLFWMGILFQIVFRWSRCTTGDWFLANMVVVSTKGTMCSVPQGARNTWTFQQCSSSVQWTPGL